MRRRATCFCFVPPQFPVSGRAVSLLSFPSYAIWVERRHGGDSNAHFLLKLGVGSSILKYHFVPTYCSTKSVSNETYVNM
ncbi:hypothetical protein N7530_004412 [Penicillium desertorum]|uniref:Uncharacterized protein n=1 Tax=Penicillium desertorum TaxID=1303715 RepID=A0A9W9WY48_9EURO|nr:hypothetical protein N7530_004412 [Penicillium desertorum]